jgi:Domain of unknown function (DUF4304)
MARYKKELIAAFKPHFKEQGFTKKDATWHLITSETIHVFNIQTSQWSEYYYFNAGIYFRALGSLESPAEPCCHIRTRIPDHKFHQESRQRANELSNFEHIELGAEERINELKNLIYPLAFDWFCRFRDVEHTKRELIKMDCPWFLTKEVWSLVNLEAPKKIKP